MDKRDNLTRMRRERLKALARAFEAWNFPSAKVSAKLIQRMLSSRQTFGPEAEKLIEETLKACLRMCGENWIKTMPFSSFPQNGIESELQRLREYQYDFQPLIKEIAKVIAAVVSPRNKRGPKPKLTPEEKAKFADKVRTLRAKHFELKHSVATAAEDFGIGLSTGYKICESYGVK